MEDLERLRALSMPREQTPSATTSNDDANEFWICALGNSKYCLTLVAMKDSHNKYAFFFKPNSNVKVFGKVVHGHEVLRALSGQFVDDAQSRPLRDVRIRETKVLVYPRGISSLQGMEKFAKLVPDPSLDVPNWEWDYLEERPSLHGDMNTGGGAMDDDARRRERERLVVENRAVKLEILGDLPSADARPDENVLFVCKLNPVTKSEDLQLIFSRFGDVLDCEVKRDFKTGDSLQYAFVEFATRLQCEEAYKKMQNVIVDARRIHVDFSQSVGKQQGGGGKPSNRAAAASSGSSAAMQRPRRELSSSSSSSLSASSSSGSSRDNRQKKKKSKDKKHHRHHKKSKKKKSHKRSRRDNEG